MRQIIYTIYLFATHTHIYIFTANIISKLHGYITFSRKGLLQQFKALSIKLIKMNRLVLKSLSKYLSYPTKRSIWELTEIFGYNF